MDIERMINAMFEECLINNAAATLAGIKAASLFPYVADTLEDAYLSIEKWNEKLSSKGIRIHAICSCHEKKRMLVYIYRSEALKKILMEKRCSVFLKDCGYDLYEDMGKMIDQLEARVSCSDSIPHEIGIFLGYPLEDVRGFIENKGKNHSFCGYWKSYGDPEKARANYCRLKNCCEKYRALYEMGKSVLELTA